MSISNQLHETISSIREIHSSIPAERTALLKEMAEWINSKRSKDETAKLTFICTHNSRRSHLSQIWAHFFADIHNIEGIECYSGGTEATAFNIRAVDCLRDQGFSINAYGSDTNPVYAVRYSNNRPAAVCFSKVYDHDANPKEGFAAVMTCSDADEACPFIPGAEKRFPLRYEDPKIFDNTPEEKQKYAERSIQIAAEMDLLFSLCAEALPGKKERILQ